MTEKYLFADVDLPFHVWVKEGARWVLRDAKPRIQSRAGQPRMGNAVVAPECRGTSQSE